MNFISFVQMSLMTCCVVSISAQEVDLQKASQLVEQKTNAFRAERELAELKSNTTLRDAAQTFADFMAENGKYGHYADDRTPAERATAAGYEYCVVRENIAYRMDPRDLDADKLAELFTQGWIDSPGHRENMLADFVTETAVAIATADGKTFYAVQLFGRPKAMAYKITVTNMTPKPWTLEIESNGGVDEIEIVPRASLKMRRCLPVSMRIPDTSASRKLSSSTVLHLESKDNGPSFVKKGQD